MASGPVAPIAKMGFVLASRPDAEIRTVQDIVAKAKNSSLSYGHWGPGSMAQMGMELLKTKAQAQVTRATSQPEFRARLADMAYTPITIDPKKFGEFVQAENQRWGAAVKAARIRIEE